MANNNSTRKRIRQNEKRKMRNSLSKSAMRTYSKNLLKLIEAKGEKDKDKIVAVHRKFEKTVDKNAKHNTIHWKTAARLKSRMASKVNSLFA